jgi:hypothetical protein
MLYIILKIFNFNFLLKLNIFNILYNIFKFIIYNKFLLFFYFIIFKFEIINININLKLLKDIFKISFLMLNVNININIKNLFYLKVVILQILKNYLNNFFIFKNMFIYFKSNYYYYKKQRVEARWALDKFN